MPMIAGRRSSPVAVAKSEIGYSSPPHKRKLRSDSAAKDSSESSIPSPMQSSPVNWKSPRRRLIDSPKTNTPSKENEKISGQKVVKLSKSPVKTRLSDSFLDKPIWNPTDVGQLSSVKEVLHVSTSPSTVVCRENEQNRILEFCQKCVVLETSGSLYVCGCPGTGKSLLMEKVKEALVDWAKEAGVHQPDVVSINCTSLANGSEIFSKILGKSPPQKKSGGFISPLKTLQHSYSKKQHSNGMKMMLIVVDELDYLITKDRVVLHDLFMLTTLPFSRCILIGIANAIDLADRFLPKLQSLNCKPMVITFRAYSKDQIIVILQRRLAALPYVVFQPQALELCARKIAAASGDLRKALWVCRHALACKAMSARANKIWASGYGSDMSAIEILEAEIRNSIDDLILSSVDERFGNTLAKQDSTIVRVDHMAVAISKAYRSPLVDTIQSLPQHQQLILCSAVKLFRNGKKDTTIGELHKCYIDVCKSSLIPSAGIVEVSNMCRVLGDQGLLKLGQSREDKLRRVTLKVDEADISFALHGVRFFRNCLQES